MLDDDLECYGETTQSWSCLTHLSQTGKETDDGVHA